MEKLHRPQFSVFVFSCPMLFSVSMVNNSWCLLFKANNTMNSGSLLQTGMTNQQHNSFVPKANFLGYCCLFPMLKR